MADDPEQARIRKHILERGSQPEYATAWAILQLVEAVRALKVSLHTAISNRQD